MKADKLIARALAECAALDARWPAMLQASGWVETCDCARDLRDTMWDDLPRAFPEDKMLLRKLCCELQSAIQRGVNGGGVYRIRAVTEKVRKYLTSKAAPAPAPTPEPEPAPAPEPPQKGRRKLFSKE